MARFSVFSKVISLNTLQADWFLYELPSSKPSGSNSVILELGNNQCCTFPLRGQKC